LKNHNRNATNPTIANPPITPPAIWPAVTRDSDVLGEADDTGGTTVAPGAEEVVVPALVGNPFWLLKGLVGTGPKSKWALEVELDTEVMGGVVPCGVDKSVAAWEEVSDVGVLTATTAGLVDAGITWGLLGIWLCGRSWVELLRGMLATAGAVDEATGSDVVGAESWACVLDVVASEVVLFFVTTADSSDVLVASLPAMVVRERGTAVHRCPLIVVIKAPAGRFALVDIMEKLRANRSRFWMESIKLYKKALKRDSTAIKWWLQPWYRQ
jgi:hypothetical protein